MDSINNRIKYIIVSIFFPTPDKYFGPFIYDLVRAISQFTHYEVVVFKPVSWREKCIDYEYEGIKVHCFKTYDLPSYILNGVMDPINVISFSRKLKSIGIHEKEIVAIHGHTINCGAYCNYLKKKDPEIISILHHHDPDPYKILHGKFSLNSINLAYRASHSAKVISNMDWNVSVSNKVNENLISFPQAGCREYYEPYLNQLSKLPKKITTNLSPDKCVVLYNGVDNTIFNNIQKVKSTHKKFIIGCNANYVNWKRHDILLHAIKIIHDKNYNIELRLLGTNPTIGFKKIQSMVFDLKLKNIVKFVKPCDHKKLPSFYTELDLFVLPSVFEGFGCVFTEAYACGVPFISCKGQAIEEIVSENERNMFFANPDDPFSLAELIIKYIEDRPVQHLCTQINFEDLIPKFMHKIGL